MRRHRDPRHRRHLRYLPKPRDAAHVVDVGLQNIDHSHLDEFAAAVTGHQPLAGGDRRGGAARDLRHRPHVLRRAGLFDEQQVQGLHFLHQDRRHARAGLGVEVHRDVDIRPERLAQHLHRFHRRLDLPARLDPLVVAGQSGLEAGHALLDRGGAQLRQPLRRAHPVGVIVAPHAARVQRTAQQPVHGHSQRLAANVPQRLVDRRNRRPHHRSGAIEAVHVHRLPGVFHLHRIAAHHEVAEVFNARHGRAGFALQRTLAPTHQPLVGLQFDEYVRPVGGRRQRHAEDLHSGDLQVRLQLVEGAAGDGRLGREGAGAIGRHAAPRGGLRRILRERQAGAAEREKVPTPHGISPVPPGSPRCPDRGLAEGPENHRAPSPVRWRQSRRASRGRWQPRDAARAG